MCGGARGSGENRGSEWATGLGFRVGGHIGHGVAGWAFAQLGWLAQWPAGSSPSSGEGLFFSFTFLLIFFLLVFFSLFSIYFSCQMIFVNYETLHIIPSQHYNVS